MSYMRIGGANAGKRHVKNYWAYRLFAINSRALLDVRFFERDCLREKYIILRVDMRMQVRFQNTKSFEHGRYRYTMARPVAFRITCASPSVAAYFGFASWIAERIPDIRLCSLCRLNLDLLLLAGCGKTVLWGPLLAVAAR